MTKSIGKFVFSVFSNLVAILVTASLVTAFIFEGGLLDLLLVSAVFALINYLIKPILKFVFGPLIFITLGLFLIVVNALTLRILDLLTASLKIQGYIGLVIATVVIGVVNGAIHLAGKWAYQQED